MTNTIRVDRDVPAEMRDGVILRGDVYRPADNEKHPAIVVRTPYNKAMARNSDYLTALDGALAGYAVIVQDIRGRFTSDGDFSPAQAETLDGYDTIEWAAAEPWCDGNVGMMGGSYLGRNQWHAAVEAPPHLKAIAPAICTAGPLSDTRLTGPIDFEQSISWFASAMAIDMLDRQERQGKDVTKAREMVMRALFNPEEAYNHLPVKDIPHFQFEGLSAALLTRMSDEVSSYIKSEEELSWAYDRVTVPCFHSGGWYDIFVNSLFKNFNGMREKGATGTAREGQYLICGPWVHGSSLTPFAGGRHFGPVAGGAAAFMKERHLMFFDKYLRGIESERPMPAVRYFVMGLNRWKRSEAWPLPETDWQRFFLHSKGGANSATGDGSLDREQQGTEPHDVFTYDPRFPVPTVGGNLLPSGSLVPGPFDQTSVERRSDVLCYTTDELKQDIEISGPLSLHLCAASSAGDTDFTVKLVDVFPNGAAYNVAEGCVRARYRKSILQPEPIDPGKAYEYDIALSATSNMFKKGHRIRIDISSSNFPRIDRNMNTGNPFGVDKEGTPAVQTIFHQVGSLSYIDMPVTPGD